MKDKLRPFQKQGIFWLESVNGIGLLADEMGLYILTKGVYIICMDMLW